MSATIIDIYKEEVGVELDLLLKWWMDNSMDEINGGFYGAVDNDNKPIYEAPKGLVLNSRILWTFATVYKQTKSAAYLAVADSAFNYLSQFFYDSDNGGFYWSVDHKGKVLDDKKQLYGQAFAIYALTAYYNATKNEKVLAICIRVFGYMQAYGLDKKHAGYFEAFSKDWQPIDDLRLSEKDMNEKKSMNTHLHIVEAYASLFDVWPDPDLFDAIVSLLDIFQLYIIDKKTHHLQLFFSEDWQVKSTVVSFGHDIEAAWLLQEAAEKINSTKHITVFKQYAISMADAASKGIDEDGGMWNEYNSATFDWDKQKDWWPQAEAMVGFCNAWQLSKSERYLATSLKSWSFIKTNLKDTKNGEWFWGIDAANNIITTEDKAGFWKCPYHNSRACIEILKRL